MLRVLRHGAVKAWTAAHDQLHGLIVSAPEPLRADLAGRRGAALEHRAVDEPVGRVEGEAVVASVQRYGRVTARVMEHDGERVAGSARRRACAG